MLKKIFCVIILTMLAAASVQAADRSLQYDKDTPIMGYSCDPAKHLGTVTAGQVLKVGTGGNYNISGWKMLGVWPVADGNLTLNNTAAKIYPVYTGQLNSLVIHKNATQYVPSVNAVVCGM